MAGQTLQAGVVIRLPNLSLVFEGDKITLSVQDVNGSVEGLVIHVIVLVLRLNVSLKKFSLCLCNHG